MNSDGLLLGLDIGSSSVKACLVDIASGRPVVATQSPEDEMAIHAAEPGWAEQPPDLWWDHVILSVRKCMTDAGIKPSAVRAIGIGYQMHGLVIVGKDHRPLRPAIIWCDSRAVPYGERAFHALGEDFCRRHLLNSPGNFTAAKLKWVRECEPDVYNNIHKAMLPGDYIAMKLSGEIATTATGLSEGVFWDFERRAVSTEVMNYFEFDPTLLPGVLPVFSQQAVLTAQAAATLGLAGGIPISYRAGDQPNNAFSLNVLNPGETAATAGTSGVVYGVSELAIADESSRVNTFVHVTDGPARRNGVLLCINGTGILNSWLKRNVRSGNDSYDYETINQIASAAPVGSDGLMVLPFGNGSERILGNRAVGAAFQGIDFNRHDQSHLFRAAQEGIVFSLAYGMKIMETTGCQPRVVRAGMGNLFLSKTFREAFVNTSGCRLELYDSSGAQGAALGAGVGNKSFSSFEEAFRGLHRVETIEPDPALRETYSNAYLKWQEALLRTIA